MRFNFKMLRNDESYEYLYSPSSFGVCLPPSDPIKHCETARGLATGNIPIQHHSLTSLITSSVQLYTQIITNYQLVQSFPTKITLNEINLARKKSILTTLTFAVIIS